MSERNKAHIRRVIEEVYNRGDLGAVAEVASSDLVIHAPSGDMRGHEGVRAYVAALRTGFPNLTITIEDQVAEGDMVVTRWVARGTHRGPFNGLPGTGKDVVVAGTDIDRFAGGKVAECWTHVDELGLLRQLGAA